MAGKFDPDVRAQMLRLGIWQEFCDLRKRLQNEQCMVYREANEAAFASVVHNQLTLDAAVGNPSLLDGISLQRGAGTALPFPPNPPDLASPSAPAPPPLSEPEIEDTSDLPSGPVNFRKAVEWVFDNIHVIEPDRATCPGPGAWGWCKELRTNRQNRAEFYKNVVPKMIPQRTKHEYSREGEFPEEVKRIDAFLAVRAAAEQAVNGEVAGNGACS